MLAFGRGLAIFSMTRSQEKANIDTNALLVVWPISSPMTFRKMRSLGLVGFFFLFWLPKTSGEKERFRNYTNKKDQQKILVYGEQHPAMNVFLVLYFLFFFHSLFQYS